MPDRFGGENIMIPLETICKNDKSFWDTKLILLYVDNQLVRIQLYRPLMDDRNLMDFAMKKYGKFNLTYQISADYDFMLRILKDDSLKFGYLPKVITKMRIGGASNGSINKIIVNGY